MILTNGKHTTNGEIQGNMNVASNLYQFFPNRRNKNDKTMNELENIKEITYDERAIRGKNKRDNHYVYTRHT